MGNAQKLVNIDNSRQTYKDFVADLCVRSGLNDGAVRGAAIGLYRGSPGEETRIHAPHQHLLVMCSRTPARFERAGIGNNCVSYVKSPGTLWFLPAGVPFGGRARSDFELAACALDCKLVNGIDGELDHRPAGELRLRKSFKDAAAQQLLKLLLSDGAGEGPAGRLYSDHLIHALAYRVLVFGRDVSPSNATRPASGLPTRILKRVVDKMQVLDNELSLESLAQESGYSRVHFVRMFRAATGRSPHNYLLNLRIERVRELLANPALSLTDIALDCGFSSHSHMTRAFRQFLGVTPSEYRRAL
ncbi:MAG TPA: helix-turn-helix transcriptional regulator [Candidatus Dormibacteraeota bacterium]|nr:helix-turn-helix transcriptional regulator [Candidatus Dormibacteraeota bacterium]